MEYTITGQEAVLYVAVTGIIAIIMAFVVGRQSGNVVGELTKALTGVISDKERTRVLEAKFDTWPEDRRRKATQIINVLDPLTPFVPGDLDSDIITWLREITDGVAVDSKPPVGS